MNLLTICDDKDTNRGEYFSASQQDLLEKLQPNISNHQNLKTIDCQISFDNYTANFNGIPFLCVAYAHGSETSIAVENEDYIHFENAYLLNQSFIYACSCLSAKQLGQQMIDNGCKVFSGFDTKISSCNPETEGIYQDCENSFMTFFVNDGLDIQECLKKVEEKYTEGIVHLSLSYGLFETSILQGNYNAFRVFCANDDFSITKDDFI